MDGLVDLTRINLAPVSNSRGCVVVAIWSYPQDAYSNVRETGRKLFRCVRLCVQSSEGIVSRWHVKVVEILDILHVMLVGVFALTWFSLNTV